MVVQTRHQSAEKSGGAPRRTTQQEDDDDDDLPETQLETQRPEAAAAAAATQSRRRSAAASAEQEEPDGQEEEEKSEPDDDDDVLPELAERNTKKDTTTKATAAGKAKSSKRWEYESDSEDEEEGDEEDDFEEEEDDDEDNKEESGVSLTDESLFNALEFHLKMFITSETKKARLEHWEAAKFYCDMFASRNGKRKKPFGRVHNRFLFAKALMTAMNQMVVWNAASWGDFCVLLNAVERACYREDRNAVVIRGSKATENATKDHCMVEAACFKKFFQQVKNAALLNQIVAPIRFSIEKQIKKGKKTCAPSIRNANAVQAIFESISSSDAPPVRKFGFRLFRRKTSGSESDKENDSDDEDDEKLDPEIDADAHEPVLKDLEELKKILADKPYNLDWYAGFVEKVLKRCHEVALADPILHRLGYTGRGAVRDRRLPNQTTPRSRQQQLSRQRQSDLSGLRRGREALNNDHGDDPLEESREIAEEATGVARATRSRGGEKDDSDAPMPDADEDDDGTPKRKRPSTTKKNKGRLSLDILFDESESDDDDDDNNNNPPSGKRPKLSKVPKKRKAAVRARRPAVQEQRPASNRPRARRPAAEIPDYYDGFPPDEDIFNEDGTVVRRRAYTDVEDNCIITAIAENPNWFYTKGTSRHGEYVKIKNYFPYHLRNRDTVMVKDRIRTLLKKENGPLVTLLRDRPGGPERPPVLIPEPEQQQQQADENEQEEGGPAPDEQRTDENEQETDE